MPSEELVAEVIRKYENAYRERTPKSGAAFARARKYMPGGDTRASAFYWPYPVWIDKASGCRCTDLDGNEYIDFHNCNTVMVLGHANPRVVQAVRDQIGKGSVYGAIHHAVIQWAEMLCNRVESFDKIRFANSGTEAVMAGIKIARAFTGKDLILKIEEGFYGTYDPIYTPINAPGLPKSVLGDSINIPFNDKEAAEKAIIENKDKLACLIVEGIMGRTGQIPPKDDYLGFLRQVTAANNVLLLFDEIQCFRVDYGGVQNAVGVKPDITILGKIIGGGLPVGAVGGREDIMNLCAPEIRTVFHSGTLTANAVTAVAGIATLEQFTASEIDRINKLGESLADGIRKVLADLNIRGQMIGWGSLQNLHFNLKPVVDGKTAAEGRKTYKDVLHLVNLALMKRSIFSSEAGLFNISTPMEEEEINLAVEAVGDALNELKPYIEQTHPELIG